MEPGHHSSPFYCRVMSVYIDNIVTTNLKIKFHLKFITGEIYQWVIVVSRPKPSNTTKKIHRKHVYIYRLVMYSVPGPGEVTTGHTVTVNCDLSTA